MSRRSALLFAAALVLPLSVLTVPAGASAPADPVSRVVLDDPTGDVWSIGSGEQAPWISAGAVPTADVVRAVVRHGRHKVVVRMRFSNLRRVEPQSYSAMIVSRRHYGAVFVSAGPKRWMGRHRLVDGNFANVKCPRLSHRINYDTEWISIAVPRRCIGRPRWVKVGMSNFIFRGRTEAEFQEITDNPHSTSAEPSFKRSFTRRLCPAGR